MKAILMSELPAGGLVSCTADAILDGQVEWAASTAYPAGSVVVRSSLNRVYRAVYDVPDTSTLAPETDIANNQIPKWQDYGPMNQRAAFDGEMKTQTIGPSGADLVFVIEPLVSVTDVWVGNVANATEVRVVVQKSADGDVVYDQTKSLHKPIQTWWDWWFAPFDTSTDAIFSGIPSYRNPHITVTLTTAGTASVGMIVAGKTEDLGRTLWGPETQHRNYSTKKLDDTWGPTGGTGGTVTRDQTYSVVLDADDAPRVSRFMADAMKMPAVWIPDDRPQFEGIRGLGQAVDSGMSYPDPGIVKLDLTIRGSI